MTPEEIKQLLQTPEGQEAIKGILEKKDQILSEKKTLQGDFNSLMERVSTLETDNEKLRNDNTLIKRDYSIKKKLDDMKVLPQYREAVEAFYNSKAVISDDGEILIDEQPLDVFAAEWQQTDSGKSMISAPRNTGGGAFGNRGTVRDSEDITADDIIKKALGQ